DFHYAKFREGDISFERTDFGDGRVDFRTAEFMNGRVNFNRSVFGDGDVSFEASEIKKGKISFKRTVFGQGVLDFELAEYDDADVTFDRAVFDVGIVSFHNARFKTLSLQSCHFDHYLDLRVAKCHHIDLSDTICRDIVDIMPYEFDLDIGTIDFSGMRLIGRIYIDWTLEWNRGMLIRNSHPLLKNRKNKYMDNPEEFDKVKTWVDMETPNPSEVNDYSDIDLERSNHQLASGYHKNNNNTNRMISTSEREIEGVYCTDPIFLYRNRDESPNHLSCGNYVWRCHKCRVCLKMRRLDIMNKLVSKLDHHSEIDRSNLYHLIIRDFTKQELHDNNSKN
ncbi:hypothetical protein LCGC14_3131190, partial [marine sediment metagenome]